MCLQTQGELQLVRTVFHPPDGGPLLLLPQVSVSQLPASPRAYYRVLVQAVRNVPLQLPLLPATAGL